MSDGCCYVKGLRAEVYQVTMEKLDEFERAV
jgi:hypothetical protein